VSGFAAHLPVLAAAFACAAGAHAACAPDARGVTPDAAELHEAEVLYLPTPHHVVAAMLELARVGPGDVVYDLGSGDGRIPIAAAQRYGVRAVGIELDARLVERARCNARAAGVAHLVEFRQQDLFEASLREATVVTLFLFPQANARLRPKLAAELAPGARVVSHRFGLGDWPPERATDAGGHSLLLWTIPRPAPAARVR
jgi:SAM-dependent methyltransferase